MVVQDRMQEGYRYECIAPHGRQFDPAFRPDFTPEEMLTLCVFCGNYTMVFTQCPEEHVLCRPFRHVA